MSENYLDGWQAVIQRQSAERRQRDADVLAELTKQTAALLDRFEVISDEVLLDMLCRCVHGVSDYRPLVAAQYEKGRVMIKEEILRRMKL